MTRLKTLITAAVIACAGAAAGAAPPADDTAAAPVQDLHYGDALFQFYQERYFASVTNLMVSQHFGRVANHADEAEVLRGGLLLSYGLHVEAGRIFTQLIEKGAAPSVRDRAWFYLAKIRYQRGLLAEAEDAVERVGDRLPPALDEERGLLRANLALARGDFARAATLLGGLTASTGAGPYARYNLGVALIKNGDVAGGSRWLDELGRAPAATEELRSLRDQANVALGFSALQDKQAQGARAVLERVRLSGMHANKALLGFGWAAADLGQPAQALVPWTELAARDPFDAAVLEAKIALPYALAELGAFGQSLDNYVDAIATFERQRGGLADSIAAIRHGKLVDGLLEQNPGQGMGWFWNIDRIPALPHARHLAPVLAQHEFQEAFKNLRDLQFLAGNLQDWQANLGVFDAMLATRRQAYAKRLPQVLASARESGLPALQQRRDGLAGELQQAQLQADGSAFADARQRDLLARIERVRESLKEAGAEPTLALAPDRLRLAAGVLAWELTQAAPARTWEAQKALKATDAALAQARGREAALAQAQRDEPARFERFAARIKELDARIRGLAPQVAALAREQQHEVQEIAVAALERQQERLAAYETQARFALAQLNDRGPLARKDDHAARP